MTPFGKFPTLYRFLDLIASLRNKHFLCLLSINWANTWWRHKQYTRNCGINKISTANPMINSLFGLDVSMWKINLIKGTNFYFYYLHYDLSLINTLIPWMLDKRWNKSLLTIQASWHQNSRRAEISVRYRDGIYSRLSESSFFDKANSMKQQCWQDLDLKINFFDMKP